MPPAAPRTELRAATRCGGCGQPGAPWCQRCAGRLAAGGGWAVLRRPPPHLPPVRVAGRYSWTLRRAILAYKERGRRDLAQPLGAVLGKAIETALARGTDPVGQFAGGPVADGVGPGRPLVVPVPASATGIENRGFDHMSLLVSHAGFQPWALLAWQRNVDDQAGLDSAGRAVNLADALGVSAAVQLAMPTGGAVVLVDDVVTTGATLGEAARALHRAGIRVVGAAALAATRPGQLGNRAAIRTPP